MMKVLPTQNIFNIYFKLEFLLPLSFYDPYSYKFSIIKINHEYNSHEQCIRSTKFFICKNIMISSKV